MLKKISSSRYFVFTIFICLHLFLLNVNYAEWGDSYRILRAAEYIRDFTYPSDEKRMPFYSFLLALRPSSVDQVLWGRLEMLGISVLSFVVFSRILGFFNFNEKKKRLAQWLFTFNPVLLYWSLRIMADVPFMLIMLVAFYLFKRWEQDKEHPLLLMLTGVTVGLGVLTRFEGYILALSVGLGILINNRKITEVFKDFPLYLLRAFVFLVPLAIVVLPWLFYRNPFLSTYFEEPAGREYDIKVLLIYLLSLFYLFGFTSSSFFLKGKLKSLAKFLKKHVEISTFVVLELILALIWPAAIPRLLVPVIPFLIIPLVNGIFAYFSGSRSLSSLQIAFLICSVLLLPIAQYFLKLQFLVLHKAHLLIVFVLQFPAVYFIFKKNYKMFIFFTLCSCVVWSISTVLLHKDIYKTSVIASKYAAENYEGNFAYNDVNAVADWYLNYKSGDKKTTGTYINMDSRMGRQYFNFFTFNIDYLLVTNEHNTSMSFSTEDLNYLEELEEFRYTIRGKEFFTKIIKFNK